MAAKKRMMPRDKMRGIKKKASVLDIEKIEYVDYKDVNLLRRFMSDRAKIRSSRVTGNNMQQQREVAKAIKNAREMALIPYANRVTTQRGGNKSREDRGDRRDGPPPTPSVPPPAPGAARDDFDEYEVDVDGEYETEGYEE